MTIRSSTVRVALAALVLVVLTATAAVAREWYLADDWSSAIARGQYGRAAGLLGTAVENGDARAATRLGNLYYLGLGAPVDTRRAAELYFLAARAGHAAAQLNLGHLYAQGLGVALDPPRAFGWYRMAHRYGNPAAEYYLTQITTEYTLSPMQIATAKERWDKLEALVDEGL